MDVTICKAPTIKEYQRHDFRLINVLSRARHGAMHLMRLRTSEGSMCVIKYPRNEKMHRCVAHEAAILRTLHHHNVVKLIGTISNPTCPVFEHAYLDIRNFFSRDIPVRVTNLRQFLSLLDKWDLVYDAHMRFDVLREIARSVAHGLLYLHGQKTVHFNLEPRNILLTANCDAVVAKIGGFSQAIYFHDVHKGRIIGERGHLFFRSPEEVLGPSIQMGFTEATKCDIWAFGGIIFCLLNPDIKHPYGIEAIGLEAAGRGTMLAQHYEEHKQSLNSDKYEQIQQESYDLEKIMGMCRHFDVSSRCDMRTVDRKISRKSAVMASNVELDESFDPTTICLHNVSTHVGLSSFLKDVFECPVREINECELYNRRVSVTFLKRINKRQLETMTARLSCRLFYNDTLSAHVISRITSMRVTGADTLTPKLIETTLMQITNKIASIEKLRADVIVTFKDTKDLRLWLRKGLNINNINVKQYPFYICEKPDIPLEMDQIRKHLSDMIKQGSSAHPVSFNDIMVGNVNLLNNYPYLAVVCRFLKNLFMLDSACLHAELYTGAMVASIVRLPDYPDVQNEIRQIDLHPQDLMTVALLTCDPLIIKSIFSKAFQCKLALPIIIKDPRGRGDYYIKYFRGLKGIILPVYDSLHKHHSEVNAFYAKMKIISFMRLSDNLSISKSEAMNDVLSGSISVNTPTFFHRNCPGGILKRRISEGVTEAAYYLPSDATSGIFPMEMIFLNLRGNSNKHNSRTDLLQKMSFVSVVFIGYTDFYGSTYWLKNMYSKLRKDGSQYLLVVIVADETMKIYGSANIGHKLGETIPERPKNIFIVETYTRTGHRVNSAELRHTLQQALSLIINECKNPLTNSFDLHDEEESKSIHIDPKQKKLCDSTDAAFKSILPYLPQNAAATMDLPLHIIWRDMARAKRASLSDNITLIDDIRTAEITLQLCQKKLRDQIVKGSKLYSTFLRIVCEYFINEQISELNFFVQEVSSFLDNWSYERYSIFNREHIQVLQLESEKKVSDTLIKTTREKLRVKGDHFFFGLHMIFREIAQIYQTLSADPHLAKQVPCYQHFKMYPNINAQLALWGFPFELLDGDATNIPLDWIEALFDSLTTQFKNSKVIVVSVIGIQSSGKSTLLNGIFGLELPVSAGGCTKGVFAQLVKVEHGSINHILVVDTEGIRGTEGTEGYRKDNEMVAFVVGLSDIVIVNIKGELYVEVSDVLEIAVHSFMRMYLQHNARHCMFVHQNVSASDAGAKLAPRRQRLTDTLNKTVTKAATIEKVKAAYAFKDIMHFDENDDTFYVGDIWIGEPPMAPTSPHYFKKVTQVKDRILKKANKVLPKSFNDIKTQISSLWHGIESNEFIFQIKDSEGIDRMEKHIHEKTRLGTIDLRKYVLEFCSTEARKVFSKCADREALNKAEHELITKQGKHLTQLMDDEMRTKAKQSKATPERTHEYMELAMEKLQHKISFMKEKRWSEIWNGVVNKLGSDEMKHKLQNLSKESKQSENTFSRDKARERFEDFWRKYGPKLPQEQEKIDYSAHVLRFLEMIYPSITSTFYEQKECVIRAIQDDPTQVPIDDLDLTKDRTLVKSAVQESALFSFKRGKKSPIDILRLLIKEVNAHLMTYSANPQPFSKQSLSQMHDLVRNYVLIHNNEKAQKRGYTFTQLCSKILFVRVLLYGKESIMKSHLNYEKTYGYIATLEKEKEILRQAFFEDTVEKSTTRL